MADDPWASFPDATPQASTPAKDDPWASFPDAGPASNTPAVSGQEQHEQRVAGYADEGKKRVESEPLYNSIPQLDLPIITPLARKAAAAAKAAVGSGDGDTFSERYANNSALQEATEKARKAQQGTISKGIETTGDVLGGLTLGGGPTGAFVKNAVPTVASTAGAVAPSGLKVAAETLGQGAGFGAADSLANAPAENSQDENLSAAKNGALLGAGTAGVIGGGLGIGTKIYGAAKGIINPEIAVAQKIAKASENSPAAPGMAAQDVLNNMSPQNPFNFADIKGVKPLVEKAAGRAPNDPNITKINQTLEDRAANSTQRIKDTVDDAYGLKDAQGQPLPIDTAAMREEAKVAARAANTPAYEAAFSHPDAQHIWTPDLENLVNTPQGRKAMQDATDTINGMSFRPGTGSAPNMYGQSRIQDPPFFKPPGETAFQYNPTGMAPDLRFWNEVKINLNKQANAATSSGEKQSIGAMQQALTGFLRDPTNGYGPAYSAALDTAQKHILGKNAFDAGLKFMDVANPATKTNPGQLQSVLKAFDTKFSPAEREQFANGIGAYIKDNPAQAARIINNGDANLQAILTKAMGAGDIVKGAQRYNQIASNMQIEGTMNAARNLQAKASGGHNEGLLAGAGLAAGEHLLEHGVAGLFHPGFLATLAGGLALKAGTSAVQTRNAQALLRMVANSHDPAVRQRLQDALTKDPKNMKLLSEARKAIWRLGASNVNAGSGSPTVQGAFKKGGAVDRNGGKAKGYHAAKAAQLIRKADTAKKQHSKKTEPILSVDDNTVAKALAVANQSI